MSLSPSTALRLVTSIRFPPFRPAWMLVSLIGADVISLASAVMFAVLCKKLTSGGVAVEPYLRLWPFLPAFLILYCAAGLYSGLALSPPEELRRATLCSTVGFVLLNILTVPLRESQSYLRPTLLVAIVVSVVLVPLLRMCARLVFADKAWWGHPAVVFGPYEKSQAMAEVLRTNPGLGLKPVAIVHDEFEGEPGLLQRIPVLRSTDLPSITGDQGSMYAIVMPGVDRTTCAVLQRASSTFSHILAVPELPPFGSNLWISSRAMGGFIGLEMKRRLLQPQHLLAKRVLDVTLAAATSLIFSPLLAGIAIAIWSGSDGPVLYRQWRIGRQGSRFLAYKFRTMLRDSDERLQTYLAQNPEARTEWERDHKLKHDPRITAIGRFLRKTSLDELPQLWNVLRGEMSLVGPRPIVDAEIPRYGASFGLYTSVLGGLTGLWQVSGRNNTSYSERVRLDEYYVRNWSVWLDLYILCRTVTTVLLRKGAY